MFALRDRVIAKSESNESRSLVEISDQPTTCPTVDRALDEDGAGNS